MGSEAILLCVPILTRSPASAKRPPPNTPQDWHNRYQHTAAVADIRRSRRKIVTIADFVK
ncbi:MAG: hypothetical protein WD030_09245 [Pirellulales bacterium]